MPELEPGDRVDGPGLVASEYLDASRLAARRRAWYGLAQGPTAEDEALEAVVEATPRDVLEVGCGEGELASRITAATGARNVATDLIEAMVSRAAARGLTALVADAARLPFAVASFDAVVASAMLYHVPDLDAAIDETARVLRPDGRLIATTFGAEHLREVWDLVEGPGVRLSFSAENGQALLARRFGRVRRIAHSVPVVFPNAEEVRAYVASTLTRRELADRVPAFEGTFLAHGHHAVFVAEEPR
jgi:SAM-dependent methyltransferase